MGLQMADGGSQDRQSRYRLVGYKPIDQARRMGSKIRLGPGLPPGVAQARPFLGTRHPASILRCDVSKREQLPGLFTHCLCHRQKRLRVRPSGSRRLVCSPRRAGAELQR